MFRTDNKNVIFTVDATAIPPIFNQDDGQRVNGFTIGSLGQITPRWQVLASLGYLDTRQISQNPLNNGKRLTLTPEFSGSLWTTYDFPRGLTIGGGIRYMDEVFVNAAEHDPRARATRSSMRWWSTTVNTHLSLRLNINNLTDEVYIKNVNNNGGRFNPGTPRSATSRRACGSEARDAADDSRSSERRTGVERARAARHGGVGRRQGDGRPSVGARQEQPAAAAKALPRPRRSAT